MKAFNSNQNLKDSLIEELKTHQELDNFIQGNWIKDSKTENGFFRGCFYGCTMQTSKDPLEKFSKKYSIDLWFVHLSEKIFEGLPIEQAKLFPLECMEKLKVGFNLNEIKSKWFKTILTDQLKFSKKGTHVHNAILQCISLFDIPFDEISASAAESAELVAKSAALSAPKSAWPAAESAWSAAESARSAADLTAWSAARLAELAARLAELAAKSAARSADLARSDYYIFLRDTLFSLLDE